MSTRRNIIIPPATGPFASLGAELALLDARLDAVDSMNEAEAYGKRASKSTLNAGQAAVNVVNSARRRRS